MNEISKNDFDTTNIFMFFIRWWKHLFIICVIAIIASVVFSSPFFITPKFEAQVTLFPASTHSISRAVLGGGGVFATRPDFLEYGEVEDAERLLQILGSSAIRERIVERFKLMEHYEIPENSQYKYTQLSMNYRSNVSFRRTSYGAVEIAVKDKDPHMAAEMANEITALVDTVMNEMQHERAKMAFDIVNKHYHNYKEEVKAAEDSLSKLMKLGLFDIENQYVMLTQQYAKEISSNNYRAAEEIKDQLDNISKYSSSYMNLKNFLDVSYEQLNSLQNLYQETKSDLENFVPFTFIVDEADVPERKSYPVRWLIVFLSTAAAAFTAVIGLMIYESIVSKGLLKVKKNK